MYDRAAACLWVLCHTHIMYGHVPSLTALLQLMTERMKAGSDRKGRYLGQSAQSSAHCSRAGGPSASSLAQDTRRDADTPEGQ